MCVKDNKYGELHLIGKGKRAPLTDSSTGQPVRLTSPITFRLFLKTSQAWLPLDRFGSSSFGSVLVMVCRVSLSLWACFGGLARMRFAEMGGGLEESGVRIRMSLSRR